MKMRRCPPAAARAVLSLSVLLAVTARSEKTDGGPVLPQWEEGGTGSLPDSGLWPDDFNPALIIHPAMVFRDDGDAASAQAATPAQAEEDSWLRFLPRGLFNSRKPQPAAETPLVDISAEALRASENAPGDARVLDPQGILGEAQTEDLTRLLAFHAENATVEARFLLLDAGQQLPPHADLSRIASGALTRGSACLVVYPLGAPGRARIFLTRNVTQVVEAPYLESLAAACRRDASENPDPTEQIQRFATQLSIRLFWLERAYPAVKPEPVVAVAPPLETPSEAPGPALSEITRLALPAPSPRRALLDAFLSKWQPWMGIGLAAMLIGTTASIMLVRWNRRRRGQTVWLLPDYDHRRPVRFGGLHCGGCGASVKYG